MRDQGRGSFAELFRRHGLKSFRALRVQQLAAKVRRARAHRDELGQTPEGAPGLPPWERCSKTNVTWLDLYDFPRGLRREHRRELGRRRLRDLELTPTAAVWLSVLALFTGLKGFGGCFVQVPVRALQLILGAGESTIQATNAWLEGEGLIERFVQRVEVEWYDDDGRRHVEADVWAKTRITRRGLARLESFGKTRKVLMAGPQRGRALVVTGLLGELLRTCGSLLRMLARRVAGGIENETPPLRGNTLPEEEPVVGARAPRAPVSSTEATGPPSRPNATSPPSAGARRQMGGWVAGELERLWRLRALTAPQAWPALYWNGDRPERRRLERDFREFYAGELTKRFVLLSTRDEQLIQQVRLEADADQLAQVETREPPEGEKRFRYHNYGHQWRAGPYGTGRWVRTSYALEDLRKEQRAKRAAGELAPTRRNRR